MTKLSVQDFQNSYEKIMDFTSNPEKKMRAKRLSYNSLAQIKKQKKSDADPPYDRFMNDFLRTKKKKASS